MKQKIIGTWQLLAQQCEIEFGNKVNQGEMVIQLIGNLFRLDFTYQDEQGKNKNAFFEQIMDGQYHDLEDTPLGDESRITVKDEDTIEAIVLKETEVSRGFELQLTETGQLKLFYSMALRNLDMQTNYYLFDKA